LERKTIVISAVNLYQGGPLSVLQDCLAAASSRLVERFDVVALVHDGSLVSSPGVRVLEYPRSRTSWAHRLYYEFVDFHRLSVKLQPFLWLSLHDITPRVRAVRRAVYCHNPAPFFRMSPRQAALDPTFALFNLFYGTLYGIGIHANDEVIVQQSWLADEFRRRYGVKRVVVAHPSVPAPAGPGAKATGPGTSRFVFPTFPRFHKNVEVLGEAATLLARRGRSDVEFLVTFDGTETRYARHIRARYGHVPALRLIGKQSRKQVYDLYGLSTGMVFPSKLETWGLPLSEFRTFGKPILAADLPYAHETLAGYDRVKFFPPDDAGALAEAVCAVADGVAQFDPAPPVRTEGVVTGWPALFDYLLAGA
jgi:glycosyltransferase involved in cell wall biosynthesis